MSRFDSGVEGTCVVAHSHNRITKTITTKWSRWLEEEDKQQQDS